MTMLLDGLILTKAIRLSTTSAVTAIEAKSRTNVVSIICAEIAGATPALTIELYDGTTSYFLRNAKPMAARETFIFDEVLPLNSGWELRIKASAANQVDCFVTYMPSNPHRGGTFQPLGHQ